SSNTPPMPTLAPYTTLFRSRPRVRARMGRRDLRARRGAELLEQLLPRLRQEAPQRGRVRTEGQALHRQGPGPHRPVLARRDAGRWKSTRLNSSHVKISYAVF